MAVRTREHLLRLSETWLTRETSYDGGVIVQRSIDLGEPVVYVSLNYR